ncbi:site-specific integrase [Mucilaginibacter ginsenosidivorax]|uniref:Site-specific integrase n=1 Tax=Mucilaginibacter ginsenosidivorax TaxID=862126 RepID=A0A5B8VVR9_9SPHI|nr:site-specific integrase [Mucilaginibacter ginsenosidivorax]QEC75251.1 site-specific integrase [Mucilaginibacter ginsenosidivorax]
MLEKSLGLMFFLKQPRNYDGGEMYIYLKITVDGVSKDVSIKRSWLPSRWNSKGNRAIGNKEDAKALNEFLDVMQNKAYDARKHLIDRGKVVTSLAIVELLSGINERKWMLLLLFEVHNKDLKKMIGKGVAKGTYTNFNTSYKHTCKFIKVIYKVDDINIRSLDLEFIKKLYNWYRTDLELNHNSALKNIANMKKIVLDCVDNGWLVGDPFAKFEMTREDVDTVYLDKEEIQRIASKNIQNERLSRVRDLFVFCCFTGLSFIDVKQLKRSEVTLAHNSELRIYKNRQKTGTPAAIPLLPIALLILKKYQDDATCLAKDMLLPVLSNQKYNSYLKEIADTCKVNKELTSKMARNSFATTVTLANNVPMETISKMMGHKSLKQTQHYAKVLAIKVTEDMVTLKKTLAKKKFIPDQKIMLG